MFSFYNFLYVKTSSECYDQNKILSAISTIARLSQIINRQKNYTNTSINHYISNHNDIPIWVLVNYLDFGEVRFMLSLSDTSLQNKVAKDIQKFAKQNLPHANTFPPEAMMSFIENINEIR